MAMAMPASIQRSSRRLELRAEARPGSGSSVRKAWDVDKRYLPQTRRFAKGARKFRHVAPLRCSRANHGPFLTRSPAAFLLAHHIEITRIGFLAGPVAT